MSTPPPLGRHLLVDLCGCDAAALSDQQRVERVMLDAALRAGATVLGHQLHRFQPQGVSGVVLIAESHLSIHTWPEHGFAAIDLFTCGADMTPEAAVDALALAFAAQERRVTEVVRGLGARAGCGSGTVGAGAVGAGAVGAGAVGAGTVASAHEG